MPGSVLATILPCVGSRVCDVHRWARHVTAHSRGTEVSRPPACLTEIPGVMGMLSLNRLMLKQVRRRRRHIQVRSGSITNGHSQAGERSTYSGPHLPEVRHKMLMMESLDEK
ncbi:hypothetical protein SETIT_7G264100v2 [Setaria italica]|uniref:Uncharacterized protein n=1 Tax=Setaria italica TaxID=4555 RepID=A0A368S1N1_SETIT|nr:hypothetical protein SETIT_7G264100v2 [Setaria italica]